MALIVCWLGMERFLILLILDTLKPTSSRPIHLNFMFHVPQLRQNLISVKKLCKDNDCTVNFNSSSVSVKDKASYQTLLQVSSKDDVYPFSSQCKPSLHQAFVVVRQPSDVWHWHLGHRGAQVLSSLRSKYLISLLNLFSNNCVSCRLGKSQHLKYCSFGHYSLRCLEFSNFFKFGVSLLCNFC